MPMVCDDFMHDVQRLAQRGVMKEPVESEEHKPPTPHADSLPISNAVTEESTVSVIIPCYNAAKFLEATVESALTQSRPPLEIIIVDDGSTDTSVSVARTFGKSVTVIQQHNQGPAIARNTGVVASHGRYLMFLDADDLLKAESLERLTAAATTGPRTVALMGCAYFRDDPGTPTFERRWTIDAMLPYILSENLANPICWLTPRELFDEVGGFVDETRPFEDWDFCAQVALTGARLQTVPYTGGLYRVHESSVMRTVASARRALGHTRVVERLARRLLTRDELLAKHGERMFWSAWTAIQHARSKGVSWRDLVGLRSAMHALIRLGPPGVRSSKYALAARYIGIPAANVLSRLSGPWITP
jgi:glycosyltransferase involved in cell wall biosynthesis